MLYPSHCSFKSYLEHSAPVTGCSLLPTARRQSLALLYCYSWHGGSRQGVQAVQVWEDKIALEEIDRGEW
jgi:hypothetical protein